MKKQWIAVLLLIAVMAAALAGCDAASLNAAQASASNAAGNSAAVQAEPDASASVSAVPSPTASASAKPSASASASVKPSASASVSAESSGSPTITVNSTATIRRQPDIAYISIGVSTQGNTAAAAQQQNAQISAAVLDAIQKQGVASKDIETQALNVYTDYSDPQNTVADNTFRVTVRDVNAVGKLLDAAVAAGANTSYSLSFDVSDPDAAYLEALKQAIAAIGSKAKAVAEAGGYSVTGTSSIVEQTSGYGGPVYADGKVATDSTAATPVSPQEIEITASVTGTYTIR